MGQSFPFFFLIKKNGAVYGLFDGHIIPHAVCSFRNWVSLICLVWESQIIFPVRVAGAPGFKLIVWSHR